MHAHQTDADPTPPADEPPLDPALRALVERELAATIEREPLPPNLRAACLHAVLAGGKRLRPILVLESARACGGAVEAALPAAVAIELVHAFSLVHDDLPALDDDDLRRGRPTCHVAYGEALAILAGDALLALAPLVAARSPVRGADIASELLRATMRMIAGQVHDTLREFPDDLPEGGRLELIHRHKTGALIEASCRMGALAAGADAPRLDALDRHGRAIGLMFQVVDDLIDATQSAAHAGKATGKDLAAGKLTYPGVHGLEASRREVERLRAEATEALAPLGAAATPLARLSEYMAVRTR
jgi:geranylgeranyl pyrophosphate synthase